MMNMFQLQERIKDFSKDQLVREMQQPSGAVPPFLILSELQRRTRMEKAFQADQAQGQQSTVAQDAIAAAGVPQGGIADMARAMAPQTDMTQNTGAAPVQAMAEGGEVRRMQPGGLTGNAELDAALRRLQEAQDQLEEATRAARGEDSALSEVSADVGSFTPAALGAPAMDADAGPLSRVDARVSAPRTAPGLPSIRPTDAQPVLLERAPPTLRDLAPPAATPGPVQGPGRQSIEDAARMREINITPGASGYPSQRDLDLRFLESQRELADATAASAGQTPDPTAIIMADGVMVPIDDRPTPIADAFRAELAGREARAAEAARMMAINELPERAAAAAEAPTDFSEFGGLPDFMTDPSAYRGEPYTRVADLFGLGPAIDAIPRSPETLPMDTGTPLTVPEEADGGIEALLPPRPAAAVAGGAGGTGGGAGGAGARATGAADADKWLALAQFGLGLMASQQPTLGGAIGEAGTAALGQLRESQREAYERDLAERTLAARSAARPDRLSLSDRLDYITDQMETVRTMLALEPDAGRKLDLANELTSLQEQAAAILGTAGPAAARAAEGATDVRG